MTTSTVLLQTPLTHGDETVCDAAEADCDELRGLISAPANNELQCRKYLRFIRDKLAKETVIDFVYDCTERRGATGDSDYLVACRVRDTTGVEQVKAYVWEAKAPQCYLFEKDTESRLRPSNDLVKAENQLLHYYYALKGDEAFRRECGVTHSDNVLFGGIIIGQDSTRYKSDVSSARGWEQYVTAYTVRCEYFYKAPGITILTWTHVLSLLKGGESFVGRRAGSETPMGNTADLTGPSDQSPEGVEVVAQMEGEGSLCGKH